MCPDCPAVLGPGHLDYLGVPEDLDYPGHLDFLVDLVDLEDLGYLEHLGWKDLEDLDYLEVPVNLDYLVDPAIPEFP